MDNKNSQKDMSNTEPSALKLSRKNYEISILFEDIFVERTRVPLLNEYSVSDISNSQSESDFESPEKP